MKRALSLLAAFISMTANSFAGQGGECIIPNCCLKSIQGKIIEDKIYLHPGMIQISQNGIVVQINNELVAIPAIESDGYGIFVRTHYLAGKVKPGDWCCTVCWNWNSSNRTTCWWCGVDRDE